MAAGWAVIWLICVLLSSYIDHSRCQRLSSKPFVNNYICKNMNCNDMTTLNNLKDCVVILGNLKIFLLEKTKRDDFKNVSFPNLREVTGYMVVHRVRGLESLGQLFPNLARIRGLQVLNNYGLIVYDMPSLREIGLFGLLKVDRGGIVVGGGPQTCFVDTVDWQTIAPMSRHVLNPADRHAHCNTPCTCSGNASTNHCWNNRKCQRFLEGPEGEKCNKECLGCRKTKPDECSVCRHYTFRMQCVSHCPLGTIILPDNQYCINKQECYDLGGFVWNKTCLFDCPSHYVKRNNTGVITCELCNSCEKTCGSQLIQTMDAIQAAERCVYINGSLVVHVRAIPEAKAELRTYLGQIQLVTDYIVIYGSITITSLDFLSSLRRIGGRTLKNGKYSLIIYDMLNLQTLFTPNVTKNLKVERGTLNVYRNPMLCMTEIDKLKPIFPVVPKEIDIPQDMNGNSGGCSEVPVDLQTRVLNETTAIVMFSPNSLPDMHYTILYVRVQPGTRVTLVPETCSDTEWYAVNVPISFGHNGVVMLTSLRPASTYAVCLESYDPFRGYRGRSKIINFNTPVGKPKPSFISELVASSSDVVVLRWLDHKDYRPHLTRYELDVTLIDIHSRDVFARDHCNDVDEDYQEMDYSKHAVVRRPPVDYGRGCVSMCGILSKVTVDAMVEENFDVCGSDDFYCDNHEPDPPSNTTFGVYVRTISLNITSPRSDYQVGGLAPYRDYRLRLRACVNNVCSKSTRGVIRTLPSKDADVPTMITANVNETAHISVEWQPPAVTNGPILAYNIEVLPKIRSSDYGYQMPQVWCVLSDRTNLVVQSGQANNYLVRVCSSSLAFSSTCSKWVKVSVAKEFRQTWWWAGIIFGILIYTTSSVIGYFWRTRRYYDDNVPLIDSTSIYRNESEPVTFMMSDFAPLYSIPLSDTHLDQTF